MREPKSYHFVFLHKGYNLNCTFWGRSRKEVSEQTRQFGNGYNEYHLKTYGTISNQPSKEKPIYEPMGYCKIFEIAKETGLNYKDVNGRSFMFLEDVIDIINKLRSKQSLQNKQQ